jgi:Transposase DDE domain
MPPTDIVRGIRIRIQNQLVPAIPKRWHKQFSFGLQAYGLRAFQSAAGNARMVGMKPHSAIRKKERLFQNSKLAGQLGAAFDSLGLVKPSSFVNIDHSDMNGLTALVGAVQTRKGRALPCMVETTYSDRLPACEDALPRKKFLRVARTEARKSQSFTGHTIDALQDFADRLGYWPRLVFDRGFGNESIVTHLAAEGCTFYIRMKAGRYVEYDGQRTEIQQLQEKAAVIQLYGLRLRVIRSPKDGKNDEPWYILTNDQQSSRTKIVHIYYHRFEIEETFKDIKHIFELKRTRLNKPLSLKLLLWFVALGIVLLYLVAKPTIQQTRGAHPKKQTSWLRQAYERLQSAYGRQLWGGV